MASQVLYWDASMYYEKNMYNILVSFIHCLIVVGTKLNHTTPSMRMALLVPVAISSTWRKRKYKIWWVELIANSRKQKQRKKWTEISRSFDLRYVHTARCALSPIAFEWGRSVLQGAQESGKRIFPQCVTKIMDKKIMTYCSRGNNKNVGKK